MPSTYCLLEPFNMVPVTDPYEWVGRVIRDFAVPRAGYTPDKTNIDPQDISDDPGFMDVEACLSHQNQAPEPTDFKAPQIRKLRLSNDEKQLAEVLEDSETKRTVMEWLGVSRPVFFVVGMLMDDAITFSDSVTNECGLNVEVKPPIKAALASQGVVLPGDEPIEVVGGLKEQESARFKARLVGNRIFAVEYRVMKKKLFSLHGGYELKGHKCHTDEDDGAAQKGRERQVVQVVLQEGGLSEIDKAKDSCFTL